MAFFAADAGRTSSTEMLENLGAKRKAAGIQDSENRRNPSLICGSSKKKPGLPEEDHGQGHDEQSNGPNSSSELSDLEDFSNGDPRALVTSSGDDGHEGDSE